MAEFSAACLNSSLSSFMTKSRLEPLASQPSRRWKRFSSGLTWKDGFFSSWNGHRPLSSLPAGLSSIPPLPTEPGQRHVAFELLDHLVRPVCGPYRFSFRSLSRQA